MNDQVVLSREIKAVRTPEGSSAFIAAGSQVTITQALGDSFTIAIPTMGGLFRVDGADADALGRTIGEANSANDRTKPIEERAWDQLKTCFDPEIPVNIVDLGLVYGLELLPDNNGGYLVAAKMTLTAPGCGMGPAIAADAKRKLEAIPEVVEATVDVVWDPPWGPDRISPGGKKVLGID